MKPRASACDQRSAAANAAPSWRAALAVLAAAMVAASFLVAQGPAAWFGAGLGLLSLAIATIDARSFLIPNELNLGALLLGLACAAVTAPAAAGEAVGLALARAAALGLAFLALRELYFRWRGREGIGLGDVKLAAVGGAWLDWPLMPVAVEIAALAALVYGLSGLLRGRTLDAAARVPFGLFLAPSIWLGWLIGAFSVAGTK